MNMLAKDLSNVPLFSKDCGSYHVVYFNLNDDIDYRCSRCYRVYFYLLNDNHTVICKFTDIINKIINKISYILDWSMCTSLDNWNDAWYFDDTWYYVEATERGIYDRTVEIFRDEIKGTDFVECLIAKICKIQTELPESFWNIPEVKQILVQHGYEPTPTEESKNMISYGDISDIIRGERLSYGEFLQLIDSKDKDYISCIKDLVWAKYLYSYKDIFNEVVEHEIKIMSDEMRAKKIQ